MSVFLGLIEPDPAARAAAAPRLRAELLRQGFSDPVTLQWESGVLAWCDAWHQKNRPARLLERHDGFAACVGVLNFRGLYGAPALAALYDALESPERIAPFDFNGNFQVAIVKRGRGWVFGDPLGMIKLYRVPQQALFSTSWLACATLAERPRVNRMAAQEYVVLGANYGTRTPLAQVEIQEPRRALALRAGDASPLMYPEEIWIGDRPHTRMEDAVTDAADVLDARFRELDANFGDPIVTALSGGYDSRLLLAGIRRTGRAPFLYVFGKPEDRDVQVAKAVAQAAGLPIEHVDKRVREHELPPLTREQAEAGCIFFDGIPADGIFDRGVDRETRVRYGSMGSVLLNGACAEVLRNFWHAGARPLDPAGLFRTFFVQAHPKLFPTRDDFEHYRSTIEAGIADYGGWSLVKDRRFIELAYPLYRGRFWISRNSSVANRVGYFWTIPFDPALVRQSFHYPLDWKDYGRLESALIARLDPRIAALESSYGFAFDTGPSRKFRAQMWAQYRRPDWLRARSTQIKWGLGLARASEPPAEIRRLFGPQLRIERLLDLRWMSSHAQWARALTLEYLFERLSVEVD